MTHRTPLMVSKCIHSGGGIAAVTDHCAVTIASKATLDSPSVRRKIHDDRNKKLPQSLDSTSSHSAHVSSVNSGGNGGSGGRYNSVATSSSSSCSADNVSLIADHKLTMKEKLREGDIALGQLGDAVDRLGVVAKSIKEEVVEQGQMLDKLGEEVDRSADKLNVVQGSLKKLLNSKDGCQMWTIIILAGVLLLLGKCCIVITF